MAIEELFQVFDQDSEGFVSQISPTEQGMKLNVRVTSQGEDHSYLLSFEGVYGFRIEHFRFNEVAVSDDHPILLFANETEAHLNYSTLPSDPLQLDYEVRQIHREYFDNWVDESEVLIQDLPAIEAAPGVLAQGPVSFIEELCHRLESLVDTHMVIHHEEERSGDHQVLFLDDNWVIFRHLIVSQVESSH